MARTKATPGVPATTKKNLPVNWKEEMEKQVARGIEQEASVATGAFITTRAGQLAFQGTPFKDNRIPAIIVDCILENAFYEGKFDADNPAPPVCYAFGRDDKTMKPHEKSTDPQAKSCKDCDWNKFGSAEQGQGKACKNIRRMAILPADTKNLNPVSVEKNEMALLKTPVTSVKPWAAYVRMLGALYKRAALGVVTVIGAVPDAKTQFKLTFEHEGDLADDIVPVSMSRMQEAEQALFAPYPEPTEREAAPARGRGGKASAVKRRKF